MCRKRPPPEMVEDGLELESDPIATPQFATQTCGTRKRRAVDRTSRGIAAEVVDSPPKKVVRRKPRVLSPSAKRLRKKPLISTSLAKRARKKPSISSSPAKSARKKPSISSPLGKSARKKPLAFVSPSKRPRKRPSLPSPPTPDLRLASAGRNDHCVLTPEVYPDIASNVQSYPDRPSQLCAPATSHLREPVTEHSRTLTMSHAHPLTPAATASMSTPREESPGLLSAQDSLLMFSVARSSPPSSSRPIASQGSVPVSQSPHLPHVPETPACPTAKAVRAPPRRLSFGVPTTPVDRPLMLAPMQIAESPAMGGYTPSSTPQVPETPALPQVAHSKVPSPSQQVMETPAVSRRTVKDTECFQPHVAETPALPRNLNLITPPSQRQVAETPALPRKADAVTPQSQRQIAETPVITSRKDSRGNRIPTILRKPSVIQQSSGDDCAHIDENGEHGEAGFVSEGIHSHWMGRWEDDTNEREESRRGVKRRKRNLIRFPTPTNDDVVFATPHYESNPTQKEGQAGGARPFVRALAEGIIGKRNGTFSFSEGMKQTQDKDDMNKNKKIDITHHLSNRAVERENTVFKQVYCSYNDDRIELDGQSNSTEPPSPPSTRAMADVAEADGERLKTPDSAVFCRSVSVSIPGGALRSLSDSDQNEVEGIDECWP